MFVFLFLRVLGKTGLSSAKEPLKRVCTDQSQRSFRGVKKCFFYLEYVAFHKVNRRGVCERLWFIGLVCVKIISAGELSSMGQCLSFVCLLQLPGL